jgi:hypothetical protein
LKKFGKGFGFAKSLKSSGSMVRLENNNDDFSEEKIQKKNLYVLNQHLFKKMMISKYFKSTHEKTITDWNSELIC